MGVQIYLGIVQKYIFIAISGDPEVARGVPGPNGGRPHFLTALDLFLKRHNYMVVRIFDNLMFL